MQQAHMQPQNEPQAETKKNCLTDLTLPKLTDYIKSIGQPAFRAKQIFKWIHQKQATDFSAMTDQPKALLAQFAQNCTLAVPTIRRRLGTDISAACGQLRREDAKQAEQAARQTTSERTNAQ